MNTEINLRDENIKATLTATEVWIYRIIGTLFIIITIVKYIT